MLWILPLYLHVNKKSDDDGPRGQLCIDRDMLSSIESLLRNLCYSLHQNFRSAVN